MRKISIILVLCILLVSLTMNSQSINPIYLNKQWNALWIKVPESSSKDYGIYLFRKSFELTTVSKTFPIHVSADNRYKLFVNEKLVSMGPARGDLLHWNFETIDLAPFLQVGKNIIAAQVWNEGEQRPDANVSSQTGFILQGGSEEAEILNTKYTWKCLQDLSYSPITVNLPATAYRAGPGELIDMQKHISGWQKQSFDDSKWKEAATIGSGYPKNKYGYGGPNGWELVPSVIPQMELKQERLMKCVKAEGINVPAQFPAKQTPIMIPANTVATLLLDQSHLTNAYSTIAFSGGKNGTITLGYAEALYSNFRKKIKGNRNDISDKIFRGRFDSIVSNGRDNQEFTSLAWRTFRYLQIKIVTKDSPLVIKDVYGTFTGYPFVMNAKLATDNNELQHMLEIGWRTSRLCAVETYMDCPYYEQLQYLGDTRIQALVSLYNSGDDRLVRNALNQFDNSRQPEGLTMARYPTAIPQYITPFSLWYIGMLHDYMLYGKDPVFIQEKLFGSRQVLNYFKGFQQSDGSLKNLPWWNFTDWVEVKQWGIGVRELGADGNSALLDLQLLWAYELAADMEEKVGMKEFASLYRQNAEQLKKTIQNKYWDSTRMLFADRSEKDLYSQHTNALAILTGVVSGKEATMIAEQLLSDTTLAPASIYFKFYVHQALVKAGFGDGYLDWLGKWRENIELGLTTWGETSDVEKSRSDCHAWGASPNIEFFRTVLGIDSDAIGFAKVKIEPHLGTIKNIGGEIPHPNGKISVKYNEIKGHMNAEITLPSQTTGCFIWKGKNEPLKAGKNIIKI